MLVSSETPECLGVAGSVQRQALKLKGLVMSEFQTNLTDVSSRFSGSTERSLTRVVLDPEAR